MIDIIRILKTIGVVLIISVVLAGCGLLANYLGNHPDETAIAFWVLIIGVPTAYYIRFIYNEIGPTKK